MVRCWCPRFVFFFFQAEDGIRDLTVTGVQTCALPISGRVEAVRAQRQRLSSVHASSSSFLLSCLLSRAIMAIWRFAVIRLRRRSVVLDPFQCPHPTRHTCTDLRQPPATGGCEHRPPATSL